MTRRRPDADSIPVTGVELAIWSAGKPNNLAGTDFRRPSASYGIVSLGKEVGANVQRWHWPDNVSFVDSSGYLGWPRANATKAASSIGRAMK